MSASAPQTEKSQPGKHRDKRAGVVIGDKRDKTRTVSVDFGRKHPKYGKYIRHQAKFHVHDPENASKVGDQVEIEVCKPISKTKSWRLVRVLQKATGVEAKDLAVPGVNDEENNEQQAD